jgi:uncharacterized protein (DUF1015 family)
MSLRGQSELMLLRLRSSESVSTAMPDRPAPVRELDVSILHTMVLERLLGLAEAEVKKGGNIEYTIDADAALSSVAEGRAAAVFLLNPPTIGDVERVSDAGATMPEKSTYFYPKLATGLVMNPLDD